MELIIAILILLLVIIFIWNVSSKDGDNRAISCFFAVMFSIIFTGVFIDYKHKDKPTALDVYNNKTILQVTYVDSMPTDTVVVFKEEFK